eukprot:559682-Pelagomonas_calceolata.AAC.1
MINSPIQKASSSTYTADAMECLAQKVPAGGLAKTGLVYAVAPTRARTEDLDVPSTAMWGISITL